MDRQKKYFELNMNKQNITHQQIMDKQNKDFQLYMTVENNRHIENLERIWNEKQLMNL